MLQMPSQKSLLTLLLTQTFLIQEATPPVLHEFTIPVFAWLFFFISLLFLLTSSIGNGHHSLGQPKPS